MASIEIKGVDALVRKLGRAAAVDVLVPPMVRAVSRLHKDIATYPDYRPGRTGTLGRKWTSPPPQRDKDGVTGKVGTELEYAPYVQSKRLQARVHRKLWHTEVDVANRNRERIVADFERAIADALK